MSSSRRIQASSANGARSDGPATPKGKARSADWRLANRLDCYAGGFHSLVAGATLPRLHRYEVPSMTPNRARSAAF